MTAGVPGLRRLLLIAVALLLVAAVAGIVAYTRLMRTQPAPVFASDEEHFLYGSVGADEDGIPYWVWLVLPRIFPEYLPGPGGYAALGFIGRDGHEMPVGFSKSAGAVPRVGLNCAACHTARLRLAPGDVARIAPGGPAHQTNIERYFAFLADCASDSRFTSATILAEIDRNYRLPRFARLMYRLVVIPRTRDMLLRLREETAWARERPSSGSGRVDGPATIRSLLLREGVDGLTGTVDMPDVWDLKNHGPAFSWDGSNPSLPEVIASWARAIGATGEWISTDERAGARSSLQRIERYLENLAPPRYPFAVDADLAGAGRVVFDAECASCHSAGGARTGSIVPADEVGTDRSRLDAWTADTAVRHNAVPLSATRRFTNFRKTNGYVATTLEGIWARAPYLHNGSVPSIAALLSPPDGRPARFWRGHDVYDPVSMGFVSDGPDAQRLGTPYDAAVPGNSNRGHEYGTGMSPERKAALIEYLKAL